LIGNETSPKIKIIRQGLLLIMRIIPRVTDSVGPRSKCVLCNGRGPGSLCPFSIFFGAGRRFRPGHHQKSTHLKQQGEQSETTKCFCIYRESVREREREGANRSQ
jgi:hypothetical protein